MTYFYLWCWNNGPGQYARDGLVREATDRMTTRASHIHAAAGFPFSPHIRY